MAFTFARGNLARLAGIPKQWAGDLASRVVPRDPERWVFGSGAGIGEGALAVWHAAQRPGRVRIWLARDDEELREAHARGMQAALASSRAGFRATLGAGVVVLTHGFGDVNRYAVRGAFVVQLWHGIPLKRLHLDAPATLRVAGVPDHPLVRRLMGSAMRASTARIGLFPVASERVASRIRSSFALGPDVVKVLGDPRDDVLTVDDAPTRKARARALLEAHGVPLSSRVVLYAPTWRDGARDPGIPTADEWRAIAAWCDRNDVTLLLRAHPLGIADFAAGPAASSRIRMLDSGTLRDVTPILPAIDELVTDYSSIAFDAAIADVPFVCFAPDRATYEASRGLYDDLESFAGAIVTDWHGVLDALDATAAGDGRAERRAHSARLRTEHVERAGDAANRVVAAIEAKVRGAVSADDHGREDEIPRPRLTGATVQLAPAERTLGGESTDHDGAERGGTVTLRWRADDPGTVSVTAPDGHVTAVPVRSAGDDWVAAIPLTRVRHGVRGPLPAGTYRVDLRDATGARATFAPSSLVPVSTADDDLAVSVVPHDGGLAVAVGPSVDRSSSRQRSLQRAALRAPRPELAVFFESFEGRVAACNPLGIDRALARLRPDVARYWSTTDASVAIPDGAIRIIEGTPEWWRVRGAARVLVVNEWLRKRWRRQSHQHVVQTWHGTPLKRLALDRDGQSLRSRVAAILEGRRWSVMLAQNDFSARVFRTAYRFTGPIWELGYPRNDRLRTPDEGLRASLGIEPGTPIVLYAPTWRDDRVAVVDHIDVERLATSLPGSAVLVRGHSRAVAAGARRLTGTVIDVTDVPDVADVLALADVVVTDYSSVMFDAASLDAPIILCQPDLADYRDRLRGFTFDVDAVAPGPIVHDVDALARAIETRDAWREDYRAAREEWRRRFAPLDDGRAGERVVRRIEAEGWLPITDR